MVVIVKCSTHITYIYIHVCLNSKNVLLLLFHNHSLDYFSQNFIYQLCRILITGFFCYLFKGHSRSRHVPRYSRVLALADFLVNYKDKAAMTSAEVQKLKDLWSALSE